MKTKILHLSVNSVILLICLLASHTLFSQVTITSCTVVFTTPDCNGCDNKDDDTKIRISVFGAHGYEVANAYYTENREFQDNNSENSVGCGIINNAASAAAFAQKIIVTIEPNGNDDWVFNARVIFTLSNGTSTVTQMRGPVSVSRGNPQATLWKL